MSNRIEVDWERGGHLDVDTWCTRFPAPGKLYNRDFWWVNSTGHPTTIDVPAGTDGQLNFFIEVDYNITPDTKWLIK